MGAPNTTQFPTKAATITPHDTNDIAASPVTVYVGTSGHVNAIPWEGTTAVLFKNLADGSVLPCRVKRVLVTSTTATDLVAVY